MSTQLPFLGVVLGWAGIATVGVVTAPSHQRKGRATGSPAHQQDLFFS